MSLGILVGTLVAAVGCVLYFLGAAAWGWRQERRSKCQPVDWAGVSTIGYKRANLADPTSIEKTFLGVTHAHSYGLDSEAAAKSPGFFAYYRWEEAREHEQEGNLFLEVVASGEVEFHEKGWVAAHQRVLQVIVGHCNDCEVRQALHWSFNPRSKRKLPLLLLCGDCASHYQAKPLSALQEALRLQQPEVVVSTVEATELGGSFRPTVLEEELVS